jgi:hypothetical protein
MCYDKIMEATNLITATEILDDVMRPVEASFGPEFARLLLKLRLSDDARQRIRQLLDRNNAGQLDESEKAALESYLLVGQFLDLLQAKARASLQWSPPSP